MDLRIVVVLALAGPLFGQRIPPGGTGGGGGGSGTGLPSPYTWNISSPNIGDIMAFTSATQIGNVVPGVPIHASIATATATLDCATDTGQFIPLTRSGGMVITIPAVGVGCGAGKTITLYRDPNGPLALAGPLSVNPIPSDTVVTVVNNGVTWTPRYSRAIQVPRPCSLTVGVTGA